MKTSILLFLFLFGSFLIYSQDTIFLKSGVAIPALIVEKGDVEIKYKKFAQPEPAGIYSVFVTDVARIHYKNGTVNNFSSNQNNKSQTSDDYLPKMKFIIGLSYNYFNRNTSDNLLLFWQALNNNKQLTISGNTKCYAVNLGLGSAMGTTRRNWFGATLQLIFTPSDAIFASNTYNGLLNEIKFNTFYYNMSMYYGHTLDHKKKLIMLIEPGIDLVFLGGNIIRNGIKHQETGMSDLSYHISGGFDWNISKRLQLNLRVGEQFVNVKEQHKDNSAKYGFATYYINPVSSPNFPQNLNDLSIRLNGLIASAGLSYSLYAKLPTTRHN